MLFAKKSKTPLTAHQAEPVMDSPNPNVSNILDVTDVLDVSHRDITPNAAMTPPESATTPARGIFLDAKPSQPEQASTGLRDRFLRKKPVAKPEQAAPAEVQKQQPKAVQEQELASKLKFKWTRKAPVVSTTEESMPTETAEEPTTTGPTEKVRKPIIVRKANEKKRKFQELPIRVFLGYLPEVTERDAREYALGIAERNCEQISLVYYDAYKMADGFAYEVHEGGNGRAYLPEIIEYFASKGRFEKGGEADSVYIRTATRMVQVERTLGGIQAFQLPESASETASDWLEGTSKMTAAIQTLKGFLVVGAALFTTGFLAMTMSLVSRIQPYDSAPEPVVERATDGFNLSPLSRWTTLQSVGAGEYVKALRFTKGKWELDRGKEITEAVPPNGAVEAPPQPSAANPTN